MGELEQQPVEALIKNPIENALMGVIGVFLGVVSVVLFVYDLLVTPEMGALIISFVVCGIGLTIALLILRRLAPRPEPLSLFGGSAVVLVQAKSPADRCTQDQPLPPICSETIMANVRAKKTEPLDNGSGNKSVSSYKASESSGAMCLITAIGVSLILGGRLSGGWEFLAFTFLAGLLVALAMYRIRKKQEAGFHAYKTPVAGGVILLTCMIGLAIVMIRSDLLRDFFGLAVAAGSTIALLLSRARRKESSRISLV